MLNMFRPWLEVSVKENSWRNESVTRAKSYSVHFTVPSTLLVNELSTWFLHFKPVTIHQQYDNVVVLH